MLDRRRTDTRNHIQAVALELFAERGYDGTSLREIAERLGVTKAALYYHYRSKEEILTSVIEEFLANLEALLGWAQQRRADSALRNEVLRRYSELLAGPTAVLARFIQEGRSALHQQELGLRIRERFLALAELLTPAEDPLTGRLRARMALMTLHMGILPDSHPDLVTDEKQRRAAALNLATELLSVP
jgi:AcrR family transcriptional regulator